MSPDPCRKGALTFEATGKRKAAGINSLLLLLEGRHARKMDKRVTYSYAEECWCDAHLISFWIRGTKKGP